MRFGTVSLDDAVGAYLAHATDAGTARFRKGRRLSPGDVAALRAAGRSVVIAAVLDPGDLGEDEAASRFADALRFTGIERRAAATGRVNFHAATSGVFGVDRSKIDALNAIDPDLTLATLAEFTRVEAGQMVATVKVIPFAVPEATLAAAEAVAQGGSAFSVHPFRSARAALIQTRLPGVKESVLDKTARVTASRLARSGSRIVRETRCAHDKKALAAELAALPADVDLAILFGASAMTDPADVIPEAVRLAGGKVERTGMPVDPGNLLVLGELAGRHVVGAPGCARSPKENGFDWVLDRLLAGIPVSSMMIAGMGVGGLLMEIPSRPSPRDIGAEHPFTVAAVVLAAGRSSRMGGPNKLLATFDGVPLVRRTVERALECRAAPVIVVVGHQAEAVRKALAGLDVTIVENPEFADGLSTSLKAGLANVGQADAAMILLADMPDIDSRDLDLLVAAAESHPESVVRAAHGGKRGNPVVLPRGLFGHVARLEGDTGARHLVEGAGWPVVDVDIGAAAFVDVDTPEALLAAGGVA